MTLPRIPKPTAETTPARRRNDAIAALVRCNHRGRYLMTRLRRMSRDFYPPDAPKSCVWDGKIKPRELNGDDWRDIAARAQGICVAFDMLARRARDCAAFADDERNDPK